MYKALNFFYFLYLSFVIVSGEEGSSTNQNPIGSSRSEVDGSVGGRERTRQISIANREVSQYSKAYNLPFKRVETVVRTLNVLNTAPTTKKSTEGEVCLREYGSFTTNLARSLKQQILRETREKSCIGAIPTPTSTSAAPTRASPTPTTPRCTCDMSPVRNTERSPFRCSDCRSSHQRSTLVRKRRSTLVTNAALRLRLLSDMDLSSEHMHGIEIRKQHCRFPGRTDSDGKTKIMCKECQYQIKLPARFFPQFHTHVECGSPGINQCFTSQGVCTRIVRTQPIVELNANGQFNQQLHLSMTVGCQCQIKKKSPFVAFV